MPRTWLLTSTTYGTWLPGDSRGSVSRVRDVPGRRVLQNRYGTPYAPAMPGLWQSSYSLMRQAPVVFDVQQAHLVLQQILETAVYRGWEVLAVAVLPNHVHIVVRLGDDVPPCSALRDFKCNISKLLNRVYSCPGKRWWTSSGSTRLLATEAAVRNAVNYVLHQPNPLTQYPSGNERRGNSRR